jgi:hypothetical protein
MKLDVGRGYRVSAKELACLPMTARDIVQQRGDEELLAFEFEDEGAAVGQ